MKREKDLYLDRQSKREHIKRIDEEVAGLDIAMHVLRMRIDDLMQDRHDLEDEIELIETEWDNLIIADPGKDNT